MHLSLDQAFCGQAGAVIFFAANLNDLVQQCGDRMYRQLHLEAGLRAEVAYLAAHALGVGCTGIGAFYDLETVRFFNLSDTTAIIYELAIGVPA
jgi:nitroreductase